MMSTNGKYRRCTVLRGIFSILAPLLEILTRGFKMFTLCFALPTAWSFTLAYAYAARQAGYLVWAPGYGGFYVYYHPVIAMGFHGLVGDLFRSSYREVREAIPWLVGIGLFGDIVFYFMDTWLGTPLPPFFDQLTGSVFFYVFLAVITWAGSPFVYPKEGDYA